MDDKIDTSAAADKSPTKIVIDMAGAMEKITPEMMDKARDIMIEGLIKGGKAHKERADRAEAERDALQAAQSYTYIGKNGLPVLARDLEDERDALRAEVERLRAALVEIRADERAKVIAEAISICNEVQGGAVDSGLGQMAMGAIGCRRDIEALHTHASRAIAEATP